MKKIVYLTLALVSCMFAFSCKKDGDGKKNNGPAVLSVVVKDAKQIYEVPKNQTAILELMVTADPTSAESYTITLASNPGLVASYNTANGTSYEMIPSGAYTLASSQIMLPRYGAKSTGCELRLKGSGCVENQVYVLPIVIDGVQGGNNFQAPDDKAAYILFKMTAAQQQGSGTEGDPYLVEGAESILGMASLLKDGETTYFKLTEDVDMAEVTFSDEKPWTPINAVPSEEDAKAEVRARRIVLDGNNHKISNFKASGPLFGILCGSVKDLTLEGFDIDSDAADAAPLISEAGASGKPEEFSMKNVIVTKSKVLNANDRVGGLISRMRDGVVENCTADCQVEAKSRAGGLIGYVDKGTITNCSASGDVKTVTVYAGGLVAWAGTVTVTGCHATGDVVCECEGINYARGGGLIGQLEGNSTITKCYATGNVTAGTTTIKGHMGGGLIGVIAGEDITVDISECYATGNVTLPTSGNWAHAGGLVGTVGEKTGMTVNIANCYATGAITVRRYSSGFVGTIFSKPATLHITNSYTTSDISGINLQTHCGIMIGCVDPVAGGSTVTASGFVAWGTGEFTIRRYKNSSDAWTWGNDGANAELIVPLSGNYCGTEGTVSQQAKALGWSEDIWDLTSNRPHLKYEVDTTL